ncbi:DUF86 domain-containing protein [Parabacteroides gordonii]|jgi:uncharacterized protein with HEPN domain|uniref:DUF86 domain-containing protein n=2 Tax=Parabacteroides gordonii TaxID=574930 RepID=A0A0F5JRS0_9BACT|nr:hypothetical protein HMPREF1536_00387 [Parabacteroides gordonii MS-1 = DSM 23371]RGP15187.1 DUF86 domain-containing protein [Parabacteroides gordonii]
MRSMSEMSILQRLEFLTMKARQAVDRTSHITSHHDFLCSPDNMDLFDATVLRVQVTGEMLKQIEDITQGQLLTPYYPQIPWRAIFGLRNVISHEYAMVDPEEFFRILKTDLPELLIVLDNIITDFRAGRFNNKFIQ